MPQKLKKELPELELIDDKTVGERISAARKKRGLTQQELADKVGITRVLLSDYETSRVRIFDEMLTRISLSIGVSADYLLGLKEIQQEENISLRYTKRIKEIEQLPEHKRRAVLKTLDDSIKANKD